MKDEVVKTGMETVTAAISSVTTVVGDVFIRLLLDAYAETNFTNLKDIKNIFSQPQFTDIGLTPLKVVKQIFGGKDKYFKCLNEIENKLYEE